MKLFIWANPYQVRWGGSFLYVVAESEEKARELLATKATPRFSYGEYGDSPLEFTPNLGPPTRVLDVPCAEVYEWSE